MRCLSKDPGERFATALDLRGARESVTFFGAGGETAGREAVAGMPGTIVVLIAGLALLIGLLIGQALR